MKKADSLTQVHSFLKENQLVLLYISRPDCSVCVSLLPQVEHLLENYPNIQSLYVNTDLIPEISGAFSIFTVPVILFFIEGKEMLRKARFVPLDELNYQLNRFTELLNDQEFI